MTSYDNLYQKYNSLTSELKIEVDRINSSGDYEGSFTDIEDLIAEDILVHDSIPSLSYKLPSDSINYGVLRVPDCTLKLLSINGEFASEDNSQSIFSGFVRHKSLIKISHGYTDPNTDITHYKEVYRGFINETSKNTKVSNDNTYQNLFIEDMLTFLLKEHTFSEYTIVATTLDAFLFELFDRSDFTDFLTVNVGNINAGFDIQNIDDTELEGQTQWLTIIQDLSIGHSYLFQKEGVLFYKSISAESNTAKLFDSDKIVKFENFKSGVDEVFEKLFWRDSSESFIAPTNIYNRSKTFNIETITNTTDRTNILATTGTRTATLKAKFKLKVVLYVNFSILDRVRANAGDYEQDGAFIWGQSIYGVDFWRGALGAASAESGKFWMIKEIKHNFQSGTTDLIVEEL